MNQPNPRSPRNPSSNTARVLAWAEAEIAEQNNTLRDALQDASELDALFASNTKLTLGTRRTNAPGSPLARRA